MRDFHNGSENIPPFVGQQSRSPDMIHLGDLIMQLDEVNRGLATRNRFQAVFYLGTGFGLEGKLVYQ